MKQFILVTLVMSLAPVAFASKARMNALQNTPQIYDFQWIFDNPNHINHINDQFTVEMGDGTGPLAQYRLGPNVALLTPALATTVSPPGAEGGFLMTKEDNKWGFYVGRRSGITTQARAAFGFIGQENPIEVMYGRKGDLNWAATFSYSNSDYKTNGKQAAMGTRLGVSTDVWDAYILVGLGSNAKGADVFASGAPGKDGSRQEVLGPYNEADMEYKGTVGAKVGGSYRADTLYFHGSVYQDGFKLEKYVANADLPGTVTPGDAPVTNASGVAELNLTTIELGVIDTVKVDGGEFFYGASYLSFNSDNKSVEAKDPFKVSRTQLPVIVGMEVTATEWMQLRGSVKQPVLLGTSKSGDNEAVTLVNSTTLGVGASFVLSKWLLETTLTGSSNGRFDFGTNTFANASLSYKF